MNKSVLNLPNLLTLYRFPAGIVVLWLILQMHPVTAASGVCPAWHSVVVFVLSVLIFLSDFYDGRLARRYQIVSNFGKILDPIADSMFFTLLLIGLALSPRFQVSIWFAVILLHREAGVQIIRRYAALRGVVLMASWAGKLKMVLQSVVLGIFVLMVMLNDLQMVSFSEHSLVIAAWLTAAVATLCGVLSLISYIKQFPAMLHEQETAVALENNEISNR